VPIYKHGELGGALGGSGATAQQDEACAQAGGAALSTNSPEIGRLDSRNMPGRALASGSTGAKRVWTALEASKPRGGVSGAMPMGQRRK
jgi:hypothetical protein